jgi:hypothetical protein
MSAAACPIAATFAGADTVGTALTSESPAATIAPSTIERIASSLSRPRDELSRSILRRKPGFPTMTVKIRAGRRRTETATIAGAEHRASARTAPSGARRARSCAPMACRLRGFHRAGHRCVVLLHRTWTDWDTGGAPAASTPAMHTRFLSKAANQRPIKCIRSFAGGAPCDFIETWLCASPPPLR